MHFIIYTATRVLLLNKITKATTTIYIVTIFSQVNTAKVLFISEYALLLTTYSGCTTPNYSKALACQSKLKNFPTKSPAREWPQ